MASVAIIIGCVELFVAYLYMWHYIYCLLPGNTKCTDGCQYKRCVKCVSLPNLSSIGLVMGIMGLISLPFL